jgi:hypothetical protein
MSEEKIGVSATEMLMHMDKPASPFARMFKRKKDVHKIDVEDMIAMILYDNLQSRYPKTLPAKTELSDIYGVMSDWCKTHKLVAVASSSDNESDSVVYTVNEKQILKICTKVEFNRPNPSFNIKFNVEALDDNPVIWRESYV